jgi:putative transposase
MPRKPRLQLAGGFFHVYARGVRREAIFRDDEDRQYFLNLLGVVVDGVEWPVLAYCLMTNHFHAVVETPRPNLSEGMHRQLGAFAQWFNERHRVEGHVFDRRYGAELVKDDAHLLGLIRYVLLNPVRAGISSHPIEYRWSSYRATIGISPAPRALARARTLAFFGNEGASPEENFERFVASDSAEVLG